MIFDILVKRRILPQFVILVKTGIQNKCNYLKELDSGSRDCVTTGRNVIPNECEES